MVNKHMKKWSALLIIGEGNGTPTPVLLPGHFRCRGTGLIPGQGTKILQAK